MRTLQEILLTGSILDLDVFEGRHVASRLA